MKMYFQGIQGEAALIVLLSFVLFVCTSCGLITLSMSGSFTLFVLWYSRIQIWRENFFTLKSYLLSILWMCNFEMHFSHLTAASAKCANLLIRLLYRGGDRKLVHPCFHQNINNIACTAETRGNIIIYGVRPQQKREVS